MRTLATLIVAAALLIGVVSEITFAHGGGQDPELAAPPNYGGGSEE
jgi:hypothetical protein